MISAGDRVVGTIRTAAGQRGSGGASWYVLGAPTGVTGKVGRWPKRQES